jgi:hypothetical protein
MCGFCRRFQLDPAAGQITDRERFASSDLGFFQEKEPRMPWPFEIGPAAGLLISGGRVSAVDGC